MQEIDMVAIKRTISITREMDEWLKGQPISLSKFVQLRLREAMGKK